jgi:Mn2+/Fe2+ NRAMP family transporter
MKNTFLGAHLGTYTCTSTYVCTYTCTQVKEGYCQGDVREDKRCFFTRFVSCISLCLHQRVKQENNMKVNITSHVRFAAEV